MTQQYAHLVETLARSLQKSLPHDLSSTLDDQLLNLPARYFRTCGLGRIRHDLHLIRALEREPLIVDVNSADGATTLRVLLKSDRPGVFLIVAGCLARHFIGIQRASIFTGLKDPLVIDHFDLAGTLAPGTLARVCAEIKDALTTGIVPEPNLPPPVQAEFAVSEEQAFVPNCSIVTIMGKNQLGFLFRIAQVFAAMNLNLLDAIVRTCGDRAMDSFYLVNAAQKSLNPDEVIDLRKRLTQAFRA